jgi:tetratricopeptide (TPR) repeat protein
MVKTFTLPDFVTDLILKRADGNPFFIEEMVQWLFDQGAIVRREGGVEITEKAREIAEKIDKAIPPTITDMLNARIDRLEEPTKHLVKVASVIGRSFFYRVLSDVAGEVEDIEGKLSFLSEIQILQPQERMGEVEYIFKHALAQEAAYESILDAKRRELHMKVAHSIEKIFSERLHEFYGMLAYHYGRAEDLEKTEEFLIKAGEEALRSSASSEALHYYEEALQLYLKKSGKDADPEKVAMLEKNIALAFFNRGQYQEAVEYFDRALNHYWGNLPKHAITAKFEFISAFFHFIIALYLPSLKFRRIPTQRDNEIVDLFYKKCEALVIINPRRFFIESFYFLKGVTNFDLTKFKFGIGIFVGASGLFSFTGYSFRLSKKILDFAKHKIDKDDEKQLILYDLLETAHNYCGGNWKTIKEYDDELVKKNLNMGEIWFASQHFYWHGLTNIYKGSLDISESIVNRLNNIYEVYENDVALLLKLLLNTSFLMECRKLYDALIEIEKGIDFGHRTNQVSLIHMFSCKARIQLLMGNIEEAEKSLIHADMIIREVDTVPWQVCTFCKSKLMHDLYRLEESIKDGNRKELFEYRIKSLKSSNMLLKQSKKVAQHRTESYKLKGVYYWLINKQKNAFKWWNRSIKEGERLGAHLELSRTYLEIGKRLLEPESKYKKLNGIEAEEYLERARVLFEEMNLQWDLDELNRVAKG